MNNPRFRNIFIYVLIGIAILVIVFGVRSSGQQTNDLSIGRLAQMIESDSDRSRITSIDVSQNDVRVTMNDGKVYASRKDSALPLPEQLRSLGVSEDNIREIQSKIQVLPPSDIMPIIQILGSLLPLVLLLGFIYLMMRQAQGTNNQALSFGKSRARMLTGDQPTVTFDDVAGADEAKEELKEVVEFLK